MEKETTLSDIIPNLFRKPEVLCCLLSAASNLLHPSNDSKEQYLFLPLEV